MSHRIKGLSFPGTVVFAFIFLAMSSGCDDDHRQVQESTKKDVIIKPNVILVLVDTLRADALGAYGNPKSTPWIDAVARGGVKFDRAIAQAPWTIPSISSIFTSLYPFEHGAGVNVRAPKSAFRTLPEVLKRHGYRTAAFSEVQWSLLQRGFDVFRYTCGSNDARIRMKSSAPETFRAARDWLKRNVSQPFFVFIHTFEAHDFFTGRSYARDAAVKEHKDYRGPYLSWSVREKATGEVIIGSLLRANPDDMAFIRSVYQAAVLLVDEEMKKLSDALKALSLEKNTVLIFTSDHGEGFEPQLKRVHHGGRLHDDLLHIPLIVYWPGHLEPRVVSSVVESIDIAPMVLSLLGLPEESSFRGKSRILSTGETFSISQDAEERAFAEESSLIIVPSGQRKRTPKRQVSLYSGWSKVISSPYGIEFYNLRTDPQEKLNIVKEKRKQAASMLQVAKQISLGLQQPSLEDQDATTENLRSLGYVE